MCRKLFLLCLLISLLAGCSTKTVVFKSTPEGAIVSTGGKSCTTPCSLTLDNHIDTATIISPQGETREIKVPKMDNGDIAKNSFLKGGSIGLGTFGVAFAIAGLGGFALEQLDEESDSHVTDLELYSLASIGVGVGLISLAELANEDIEDTFSVHTHFLTRQKPEDAQEKPAFSTQPEVRLSEDNLMEMIRQRRAEEDPD